MGTHDCPMKIHFGATAFCLPLHKERDLWLFNITHIITSITISSVVTVHFFFISLIKVQQCQQGQTQMFVNNIGTCLLKFCRCLNVTDQGWMPGLCLASGFANWACAPSKTSNVWCGTRLHFFPPVGPRKAPREMSMKSLIHPSHICLSSGVIICVSLFDLSNSYVWF